MLRIEYRICRKKVNRMSRALAAATGVDMDVPAFHSSPQDSPALFSERAATE